MTARTQQFDPPLKLNRPIHRYTLEQYLEKEAKSLKKTRINQRSNHKNALHKRSTQYYFSQHDGSIDLQYERTYRNVELDKSIKNNK